MKSNGVHLFGLVLLSLLAGCPDPEPAMGMAEGIFVERLGGAMPRSTSEQLATFERGREVALRRFSKETGLGPTYNLVSCAGCHEKPVLGGSASHYRDFLLVAQVLPDGSYNPVGKNGVQDTFTSDGGRVADPAGVNQTAARNPMPFFGTGLIASLDEEAILANADPDDKDGDGISGRPNYDRGFVGRFGRKAQTVSIEGFIRGPLFNHLGLTSHPLPNALKAKLPVPSALPEQVVRAAALSIITAPQAAAPDEPNFDDDGVPDPELSESDLFDLVSFAMLIAPPLPRPLDDVGRHGQVLFEDMGCASCHTPTLRGPDGLVPLYSDLLLHDMGETFADGVAMGVATGSEYRTQPLWGIAAVAPYLHDGRADTLDDAIRWHGGEGQASRDRYVASADADCEALIVFLESLGGADDTSEGLLPQDAPIPEVGAFAGPRRELSADETARFRAGREIFDRDVFRAEGLGPVFNGDACRSCHFDPVLGGSGPNDVNVLRHGRLLDGDFAAPPFGTITHHHATTAMRPPFWAEANVVEQRQTPPLFGAGLIDQVDTAAIEALADPDDRDSDGISGRVHRLPDGRIGRFGWKAQVPSVAEFARDASSAELGLSVAPQDGLTFGVTQDGDDVADPELSVAELEDLTFFMSELAPPPRRSTRPSLERRGENLFMAAGCGSCHTPALPLMGGGMADLYSDLLLHDVAPADAVGIGDGDAAPHEFRTAPLWGVSQTGPWMHDGQASTLGAAIAAHFAESDTSRRSFEALSAEDQRAVIAFLESL